MRCNHHLVCCTCSGLLLLAQVFGRRRRDLTTRCGGRRLKSAKARNRGGEWYDGSTAGYGDLAPA